MIELQYTEFKSLITANQIEFKEISLTSKYILTGFDGHFQCSCTIYKNTDDSDDYETNYQSYKKENLTDKDDSGRFVVRQAITNKGWSFLAHFVEMSTSTLNGVYCEKHDGNQETSHYAKFYDTNGVELTTQADIDANCVKSVFTIVLGIDYEVVSGEIHQYERPISDVRVHSIIGIFDSNGNSLGSTEFVRNLNLKFKDKAKAIVTDGRAPKLLLKTLSGVPYDANQIQIVVNHEIGFKHDMMVELEYYRQ